MSFQAMTWALRQKTGSPTAKAILLALANYADDEGSCYPGQDRLAGECECSVRTIQRQLDYLEAEGFLKRSRRVNQRGARTSDRFFLVLSDNLSPDTGDAPTRQNVGDSKEEPTRKPVRVEKQARENAVLRELQAVLDADRAQAVLDHRKQIGKPLTAHAAALLAKRFSEAPDANGAADEMIANGWQGFLAHWPTAKRRRSGNPKRGADEKPKRARESEPGAGSADPTHDKVKVSAVDDYPLFRRCEQLTGKEGLKDKTGTFWWFASSIVQQARHELGVQAHG